ncbi:hypothetical protein F5X68DRAFT_230272 [Plectosphaerella plurivora]|uniref:Uncharacterized protein n=1 Tax=Plectosphaerella plurivora TaxID=936078 RepID=A0A9P8VGR9_9PEZI|nr:hypothetical protein F5X68DRAFT_230272 [Plectosphaerella plurivora]
MVAHVVTAPRYPKVLPVVVFGTAAAGVVTYVRAQLMHESDTMDRFFSKYNSPQSEESRRRAFEGHVEPRSNILNFLSWKNIK